MASKDEGSMQEGARTTPPEPLRFVNLDKTNLGRDPGTKKLIRSHVMQRYRRGKAAKTPSPLTSPPMGQIRRPSTTPREVLEEVLGRLSRAGYACQCESPMPSPPSRRVSLAESGSPEKIPQDESCFTPLFTICSECGGCIRAELDVGLDIPAPTSIVGASKTDPFNTLPLIDQTQSFYLLDHYSHVVLGLSLPMNDPQIRWFKRVLADDVLLHSLLLYAAKHNEILTGSSREVEIYCHRGEVMRIVNERIGSAQSRPVDTTIDAVACLVLFEEMFGIHDVATAHRAGLDQLVTFRGGLDSFGNESSLHRLITWARAEKDLRPLWESREYLPLPSTSTLFPTPTTPIRPLPLTNYNSIPQISLDSLPPTQMEIFCRLRNSTILVSSVYSRHVPKTPPLSKTALELPACTNVMASSAFKQLASHLEDNEQYVLKSRMRQELVLEQLRPESERRTAWLIAAILYTMRILSLSVNALAPEARTTIVSQLIDRLQAALLSELSQSSSSSATRTSISTSTPTSASTSTSPSSTSLTNPKPAPKSRKRRKLTAPLETGLVYAPSVLLWMLLLGGSSAARYGLGEEEWFAEAVMVLGRQLGLRGWVDVRSMVRELPWSEEGVGGEWRVWWEGIGRVK